MLLERHNIKPLHGIGQLERPLNKLQRLHKNSLYMAGCKLLLSGMGTVRHKRRRLEVANTQ